MMAIKLPRFVKLYQKSLDELVFNPPNYKWILITTKRQILLLRKLEEERQKRIAHAIWNFK
jgi:hypothetical protein